MIIPADGFMDLVFRIISLKLNHENLLKMTLLSRDTAGSLFCQTTQINLLRGATWINRDFDDTSKVIFRN